MPQKPAKIYINGTAPDAPIYWYTLVHYIKTFPPHFSRQVLVEETEELLTASLAAMREDLAATPAWARAPKPTDQFLWMFLRSEAFAPAKAAQRYRNFWKVCVREAAPGFWSEGGSRFRKTKYCVQLQLFHAE